MGYESKLVIGRSIDWMMRNDPDGVCVLDIVQLNLSKCDIPWEKLRVSDQTYYYYADDGDTHIVEDKYGDKLYAVSIPRLLELMREKNSSSEYRRYELAIAVLEQFTRPVWGHERIVCLHFGY